MSDPGERDAADAEPQLWPPVGKAKLSRAPGAGESADAASDAAGVDAADAGSPRGAEEDPWRSNSSTGAGEPSADGAPPAMWPPIGTVKTSGPPVGAEPQAPAPSTPAADAPELWPPVGAAKASPAPPVDASELSPSVGSAKASPAPPGDAPEPWPPAEAAKPSPASPADAPEPSPPVGSVESPQAPPEVGDEPRTPATSDAPAALSAGESSLELPPPPEGARGADLPPPPGVLGASRAAAADAEDEPDDEARAAALADALYGGPLMMRIRITGIVVAVLGAVAVHFVGLFTRVELVVTTPQGTSGLAFTSVIIVSLSAGLAAWLAAVVVAKVTPRPRLAWTILAGVAFVASLIPLFGLARGTAFLLLIEHLLVALSLSVAFRITLPERR